MRNIPNSKWLHLPLDQRPAFFKTESRPAFLPLTFYQLLLLSRPDVLAQTAEDSPRDTLPLDLLHRRRSSSRGPSRFCSVLETMIQFIQIFNIAYVKIAKEGTMSARRGFFLQNCEPS